MLLDWNSGDIYTRIQVDSSKSRIEILKSFFGPKFPTLAYPFSMAHVWVELKKNLSDFAQNFPTYTWVYTVDKLLWERLSKKGLVELYRQSDSYMIWSSDHWNISITESLKDWPLNQAFCKRNWWTFSKTVFFPQSFGIVRTL